MLCSTSPREALLACPPSPPWNPSSFTMESTLSFPCSCSDLPLSCQDAALAHFDSSLHDLVFWTDGSMEKEALAYLPAALSVTMRLLFPFQQAQYAQVSLLKSVPFCKPLAGLGSINKSPTSLFFSAYLTLTLFLPPCPLLCFSFNLNLSGRFRMNCLLSPPVLSGYNGSPDTHFSWGMTWLMIWPDEGATHTLCNPL